MKLDYSEMIQGYLRTLSPHKRYIDGGNYENIYLLDIRANRQMSPCKLYLVAIQLHLRKIDELLHLKRIDEYSYYRTIFKNVKAYRRQIYALLTRRCGKLALISYVCIVFICYLDIFSLNIVQLSKPLKQKQLRHRTLHPPFYIHLFTYTMMPTCYLNEKKIFIFNKIVCSNMHNI